MKNAIRICFILLILLSGLFVSAQTTVKATNKSDSGSIEAYYFHNTSRCVTCKAVESEAKANLESLYGKKVTFKALNLEEDATKPIAEKLEISGQTLLIVKGDKKINLTNEGFMYARTNPAKFKQIIKEKVDQL
jgi:hypothetical protein